MAFPRAFQLYYSHTHGGEGWILNSYICAVVGMCSLHNRVEDYLLCDDTSMHHVYMEARAHN